MHLVIGAPRLVFLAWTLLTSSCLRIRLENAVDSEGRFYRPIARG